MHTRCISFHNLLLTQSHCYPLQDGTRRVLKTARFYEKQHEIRKEAKLNAYQHRYGIIMIAACRCCYQVEDMLKFNHPNIIQAYMVFEEQGINFIEMERTLLVQYCC